MTTFDKIRPAAVAALVLLAGAAAESGASSIPMPAGSRSWILVSAGDCDDDGPNAHVDRGHCVGAVSQLLPAGDIGHGQLGGNYQIHADAVIGPEVMRGSVATFGGFPFAFLDMSMIDTYTLHSATLPVGTPVEITLRFEAEATLTPQFNVLAFGGGAFEIRIGDGFITAPIQVPENTRVTGSPNLGPAASAQVFYGIPQPNGNPIAIALDTFNTFTAQIGVPFDRAFHLGARPGGSIIDFHNTASISFDLPADVTVTSTGGYGATVSVAPTTWSAVKARFN
jgi:hypothetical protein